VSTGNARVSTNIKYAAADHTLPTPELTTNPIGTFKTLGLELGLVKG